MGKSSLGLTHRAPWSIRSPTKLSHLEGRWLGFCIPNISQLPIPGKMGGGERELAAWLCQRWRYRQPKDLQEEDGGTAMTTALQHWVMGTLAGEGDLNRKPQHLHTTMISPFGR